MFCLSFTLTVGPPFFGIVVVGVVVVVMVVLAVCFCFLIYMFVFIVVFGGFVVGLCLFVSINFVAVASVFLITFIVCMMFILWQASCTCTACRNCC